MMTIEELSNLSDEELRVMCARAHGYTLARVEGAPVRGRLLTQLKKPDGETALQFWWDENNLESVWPRTNHHITHNYPHDLNAMHEAEKTMSVHSRNDFNKALWEVCGNEVAGFMPWNEWFYRALYSVTHATARQRCVAFIAVKQTGEVVL